MFCTSKPLLKAQMLSLCLCADSQLSRFDPFTLSSQMSMELLVDGLGPAAQTFFQNWENGDYKEIAEWDGVTVNADGDVQEISWRIWSAVPVRSMSGTFDFRYLPRNLQKLYLVGVSCECTLDFAALPDQLTSLRLSRCDFTGSVDLAAFPSSIIEIEVEGSCWEKIAMCGTVDLTRLPPNLEHLSLRFTQLSGTIDLAHLNPMLKRLYLTYSAFSGSVTFENLPATLCTLGLNNNALSGEIDLFGVSDTLKELNINGNNFSGTLDLNKVPQTLRVTHGGSSLEDSFTIIERK